MFMVQRMFTCARIPNSNPNPPLTQSSPDARAATEWGAGGGGGVTGEDSHRLTERKGGGGGVQW